MQKSNAWSTCIFTVAVGCASAFSTNCGGDDAEAPPVTTGGPDASKDATTSTPKDAVSDGAEVAQCRVLMKDSPTCLSNCACDGSCAQAAVDCLTDARCKSVIDCSLANNCTLPTCVQDKCAAELSAAGAILTKVLAFGSTCLGTKCATACPSPDGGNSGDAAKIDGSDAAKPDAPASDAPTSDAANGD
jgi:hypothetical protein